MPSSLDPRPSMSKVSKESCPFVSSKYCVCVSDNSSVAMVVPFLVAQSSCCTPGYIMWFCVPDYRKIFYIMYICIYSNLNLLRKYLPPLFGFVSAYLCWTSVTCTAASCQESCITIIFCQLSWHVPGVLWYTHLPVDHHSHTTISQSIPATADISSSHWIWAVVLQTSKDMSATWIEGRINKYYYIALFLQTFYEKKMWFTLKYDLYHLLVCRILLWCVNVGGGGICI